MVINSIFCVHIILNASSLLKLNLGFDITVESHAAVRIDKEISVTLYPVSINGNILQNCSKVSKPRY